MSMHYCKVGKTKPSLKKLLSLKAAEDKSVKFVEVVYKKNHHTKDLHVAS